MKKHFITGKYIAEDTETTGLSVWRGAAPFAFSFCNDEGDTEYFEFPVDPWTRTVQYSKRPAEWRALRRLHADPNVTIVMHNAKFDVRHIRYNVGVFRCQLEETMFAVHCCNSGELNLGLKPLAKKYADYPDKDQKELQSAIVKLRCKAKKLGWKIGTKVSEDYWLCMYAVELLGDCEEAHRILRLCRKYAVGDAERTMLLWIFFNEKMKELGVRKTYRQEMRLWPTTYAMEERGVRIDPDELKKLDKAYRIDEEQHDHFIQEAGRAALKAGVLRNKKGERLAAFNPNSHPQLASVIYDHLKLKPPAQRGKSQAARPTNADALLELSASSELPDHILKHRGAVKARQFLASYRSYMVYDEELHYWKLHADFNQVGPRTGRYSCRTPALHQVASKSAGRAKNPIDVRAPFGPAPGCIWYCPDYSQLEVRIFADLAQERELLRIINSGVHVHSACANHVWGGNTDVAIDNAIDALGMRRVDDKAQDSEASMLMAKMRAKYKGKTDWHTAKNWLEAYDFDIVKAEEDCKKKNTMNKGKLAIFTKIFGGGIPAIMNLMKCSRDYAAQFLKEYTLAFPDMEPFMRRTTADGRREGCVWTAFGRRIAVDPEFAYRGVNYRVQGSAADLMKRALRLCEAYLRDNDVRGWIVMTIHDEIIFEFERGQPRMEHVKNLCRLMEDDGGVFSIPMLTTCEAVDKRWVDKRKCHWATAA